MKQNSPAERLVNGLVKEIPTFVLMLGMCPTLAVTTSAINGLGMGLTTMEIVDKLESAMGVPTLTSHQATLWSALRHCRVNDRLPGLGKLFTI